MTNKPPLSTDEPLMGADLVDPCLEDMEARKDQPKVIGIEEILRHSQNDGNPWREYERRKAIWKAANPRATCQQYEAAIRRICDELGI